MKEKGTILYIGAFELPDKNAAAHRVVANGKLLRDLGYRVIFIGSEKNKTDSFEETKMIYGFECFSRKYPENLGDWIDYFFSIDDYEYVVKRYKDIKAIICYNMPSLTMYKLRHLCHKKNIKIVSDSTEWYKGSLKNNFLIGTIKRVDSFLRMKIIHKKLDGIIAISEYLSKYYKNSNVRTIKIPPLIDHTDVKWQRLNHEKSDTIQIVYAGGAFSLKDVYVKDRLDLVIQALSVLKRDNYKFFFKIVGCELEEFRSFYPHLSKDVDVLKGNIRFYGKVAHNDAINIVKSSDFSIFIRDTSVVTQAGFPTKFVESISSGIPVLTNENSNITDYLVEGVNGFIIKSDNLESMIAALRKPLSINKVNLQRMKDATYESSLFDYRNFSDEFKSFFSNL